MLNEVMSPTSGITFAIGPTGTLPEYYKTARKITLPLNVIEGMHFIAAHPVGGVFDETTEAAGDCVGQFGEEVLHASLQLRDSHPWVREMWEEGPKLYAGPLGSAQLPGDAERMFEETLARHVRHRLSWYLNMSLALDALQLEVDLGLHPDNGSDRMLEYENTYEYKVFKSPPGYSMDGYRQVEGTSGLNRDVRNFGDRFFLEGALPYTLKEPSLLRRKIWRIDGTDQCHPR